MNKILEVSHIWIQKFLKNFATLRHGAFFHDLAHITGNTKRIIHEKFIIIFEQASPTEFRKSSGFKLQTWFALAEVSC